MDPWVLWLIAAVIFAVGEIASMSLFLAPFAGGAAVAAVLSAVGAGAIIEWSAFLVVSVILLAALRPIAREHQRTRGRVKTGTAALVGQTAMVVERIANAEGVGCVKLGGEIWTARAYDDDEVIEPGTRVHVLEIRGATALVTPVRENPVTAGLIALIVLALFVFIVAAVGVRIVPQARAGIVERLGRYSRTLEPGLTLIVPSSTASSR